MKMNCLIHELHEFSRIDRNSTNEEEERKALFNEFLVEHGANNEDIDVTVSSFSQSLLHHSSAFGLRIIIEPTLFSCTSLIKNKV